MAFLRLNRAAYASCMLREVLYEKRRTLVAMKFQRTGQ